MSVRERLRPSFVYHSTRRREGMAMAFEHLVISFDSGSGKVNIAMNGNGNEMQLPDTDNQDNVFSKLFLNKEKGMKLNYIRLVYMIGNLGFLTYENGRKATFKDIFKQFGWIVNEDLSDYNNHLSKALSSSTGLEKNLKIFEDMQDGMTNLFNSK